MLNDPLSNALSKILNCEKTGKSACIIKPTSKLIKNVLNIMKDCHYVGSFNEIKDGRGNLLELNLLGNINKCGAIKPRYSIKTTDYEKFEKRYLPAKGFGILVVSTNSGLMTHTESIKRKVGGKLIAYVY